MYLPGQVVWSWDTMEPVVIEDIWDPAGYPKRHTHFIISTGHWFKEQETVKLFVPRSIEHAKTLLSVGIIAPAPGPIHTHCWRCGNWFNNCKAFGCIEGMEERAKVRRIQS